MIEKNEIKGNRIERYKMLSIGFKFLDVERLRGESYDDYLERSVFIGNNFKLGEYDLETLIEKSKIYSNIKVLGCKYSANIMEEISRISRQGSVSI